MNNLYEAFHDHFEVVSANTPDLIETAYRLRYQVYCLERPYEDAAMFPDQMEYDAFDLHSTQSLVKCRKSGQYTGLVRLVLPNPVDQQAPLPMEKFCFSDPAASVIDLYDIPRESIAEISRFSVSKELRQSSNRAARTSADDNAESRAEGSSNILPQITLGLFAGIVRMSAENNITHWLAVMEPTLLRFLTRYGIYFQPAGPLVDYHGMRQPAVAEIDSVLSGIYFQRRDVWEIITDHGQIWPLGDAAIQEAIARDKPASVSGHMAQ